VEKIFDLGVLMEEGKKSDDGIVIQE